MKFIFHGTITPRSQTPAAPNRLFLFGLPSFLVLALVFLAPACFAQENRVQENFDENWQFHKGDIALKLAVKAGGQGGLSDSNAEAAQGEEAVIAYSDKNKMAAYKAADWKQVNLPHDWLVEEPFTNDNTIGSQPAGNGYRKPGIGFYRKEFLIPGSDLGRKIRIEFDGIFRNSTVWVNGQLMGHHNSGYTPSSYDLTDVLRYGKEGKNVILVKVDASDYEGWWYEGCGIYRHVFIYKTDRLHVGRFGTYVTTPVVSADSALVRVQTTIRNEYDDSKNLKLMSTITDPAGKPVGSPSVSQQLAPSGEITLTQQAAVRKPELWAPEHPHLYTLTTQVFAGDKLADTYTTVFGIRNVVVTEHGFFLNGKLYPIKGTANHQDFAGVGVAVPDKIQAYKIKLLKEMGSNGYRTAHHPPSPELLDICDRQGMLVLDEHRLLNSSADGLDELKTLILRDRNHPSVFMWSLENEETLEGTAQGARILKTMVKTAHALDPGRQTTAAMNHGWNTGGYSDVVDVVGYNYGQRGMQYVKDHARYPGRKMFVTESTSYVATRGEYADDRVKGYVSNFGMGLSWGLQPGQDWKHVVQYPYLSGTFVWTGFDYRGEPTPYQWPCVNAHFGIMDMCGFPKDGYYAYKAAWTDTPVVHIFPHWSLAGREGQPVKMRGYANCDKVDLYLNGKRVFSKAVEPFEYFETTLVYQPGRLEARGYRQGKLVSRETIETTGAPAKLSLSPDVHTLSADGRDVAIVNVAIRDRKGRVVPTADNPVSFRIEGPGQIIGTGNGNPSSHEPEKAPERRAFNGYCQVLIQSGKTPGKIIVKAVSPQLGTAEVYLTVE